MLYKTLLGYKTMNIKTHWFNIFENKNDEKCNVTNAFCELAYTYTSNKRKFHNLKHLEYSFNVLNNLIAENKSNLSESIILDLHTSLFFTNISLDSDKSNCITEALTNLINMGITRWDCFSNVKNLIATLNSNMIDETIDFSTLAQSIISDTDLAWFSNGRQEYIRNCRNLFEESGLNSISEYALIRTEWLMLMLNRKRVYLNNSAYLNENVARSNMEWELNSWTKLAVKELVGEIVPVRI